VRDVQPVFFPLCLHRCLVCVCVHVCECVWWFLSVCIDASSVCVCVYMRVHVCVCWFFCVCIGASGVCMCTCVHSYRCTGVHECACVRDWLRGVPCICVCEWVRRAYVFVCVSCAYMCACE